MLAGITELTMFAYGISPQFCFARTLLFMTSPSDIDVAAADKSCRRSTSFFAAYGRYCT